MIKDNHGGRPAIKFSKKAIEALAQIGATQAEMAAILGVSVPTIERRLAKPGYRAALDAGHANMNLTIRRGQLKAVEEGNPALLIWMGKQRLGQRDSMDTAITGSAQINVVVMPSGAAAPELADGDTIDIERTIEPCHFTALPKPAGS